MDRPIPIPRHFTALMQHLLRLASRGHVYWCHDTIHPEHLQAFIGKWSSLGLRADAPARAYRKQCGRAGVHLCLPPEYADGADPVRWWMLSTAGKDGLASLGRPPAPVFDLRCQEGRLRIGGYELVALARRPGGDQRSAAWTWRLTTQRYCEWEALMVARVKARDIDGLRTLEAGLRAMPMFGGIRDQVARLLREMARLCAKHHLAWQAVDSPLPVMRMVELWRQGKGI